MNKPKKIYILSLLLFACAFFLLIAFLNSGRANLIAGVLVPFAFGLNLISYYIKPNTSK